MINKKFKIEASQIKTLIPPMGSCIASDKITVDGLKVGYMYREESTFDSDSGWRFFSGTEDDEYINNSNNLMIYDINTIANYDSSIIPYLNLGIGVELLRQANESFEIMDNL